MFNKKNNHKVEEYINNIINELKVRKEQYHITDNSDIKMNDNDFNKLHDKLIPVINKIINNGNDFILTKDYIFYLSYLSLGMIDYQKELLRLLNELITVDDSKLTKLYKKYFNDILYNKYLKEFDNIDDYLNRMEGDYKIAFETLLQDINKLHTIFIRGYEYDLLDQISSLLFARCAKTNNLGLYNKLSRKYFTDPRQTIDYFSMNGFIDEHYNLIDNFNDYINNDLNTIHQNNIIR